MNLLNNPRIFKLAISIMEKTLLSNFKMIAFTKNENGNIVITLLDNKNEKKVYTNDNDEIKEVKW
jgi:hypothetical protein